MRYLKNFGLLLIVTSTLAACQMDDFENDSDVISNDTNAAASKEEANTDSDTETEETAETEHTEAAETEETDQSSDSDAAQPALDDITAAAADVESYKAELNMSASIDNMEPRELNAEVLYVNSSPPELLLRSFGEDRMVSKDGQSYYNNDSSWVDISDSVDTSLLYKVTYDEAVASFKEIAPHMEKKEEKDKTVYTYNGSNDEIYKTLESLVQVNFGEMKVENVNTTVETVVNEENNLIEEMNFEADGTDAVGTFEFDGTVTFNDFNSVEEVELPDIE